MDTLNISTIKIMLSRLVTFFRVLIFGFYHDDDSILYQIIYSIIELVILTFGKYIVVQILLFEY